MRYNTVIFDLDGTLVETRPGIENALRYALNKMGLPEPDDERVRRLIGPPLAIGFAREYALSDEDASLAVRYYREYYGERGMFEAEPYPGIEALLQDACSAGIILLVATLKPEVYAGQVLAHVGLRNFFQALYGPTLGETQDIKEQLVHTAVRSFPGPAAMVGDRAGDILAGNAAEIDTIAVLYGYGSREELDRCSPTYWAQSAFELSKLLL